MLNIPFDHYASLRITPRRNWVFRPRRLRRTKPPERQQQPTSRRYYWTRLAADDVAPPLMLWLKWPRPPHFYSPVVVVVEAVVVAEPAKSDGSYCLWPWSQRLPLKAVLCTIRSCSTLWHMQPILMMVRRCCRPRHSQCSIWPRLLTSSQGFSIDLDVSLRGSCGLCLESIATVVAAAAALDWRYYRYCYCTRPTRMLDCRDKFSDVFSMTAQCSFNKI